MEQNKDRICYGVFSGTEMIAEDNRIYPIQGNYASKSRLVEGDKLKLTITENGEFVFKQIEMIERKRVMAKVSIVDKKVFALAGGNAYRILQAAQSYFKLKEGDEVIAIIPKFAEAEWCAIDGSTNQ